MHNKIQYNKKLLLVIRIVLFVIGAILGSLAIWQVFFTYPDLLRLPVQIVFYVICAAVTATVLTLSAHPVYSFLLYIYKNIKKRSQSVRAGDIAGITIGAVIGIMIGYLCDVLLSLFMGILAVRILIDVIVGAVAVYFSILFSLSYVNKPQPSEESIPQPAKGYLLDSAVFSSDKIVMLCTKWLIGEKFVLEVSANLLAAKEGKEKDNFELLTESGGISVLKDGGGKSEKELLISFALKNNLKILTLSKTDEEFFGEAESLSVEEL